MIDFSLEDSGIFYVKFLGTVSTKDIKKYLNEFDLLNDLPENLVFLYDLRGVRLKVSFIDLFSLAKLAKKVTSPYKSVNTAFVVNKPKTTFYSILFTRKYLAGRNKRKVFSREKYANEWLNSRLN